jgi:ZIP family zinc transporter
MLEAAAWGLLAGSSLLIGAAAGLALRAPSALIGLVLGFGAGTLISAISFELTEEAYRLGGADAVAIGLAAGALTFFLADLAVDRHGGEMRMAHAGRPAEASATALLLGAILDGIPESAVIGTTLLGGGEVGLAVVAAVFLSNLPEAFSSAAGMRTAGGTARHVLGLWALVTLACGAASAIGFLLLEDASGNWIGLLQAFAAGGVLTLLADAMMPEAFRHGGRATGLVTVLGFALAFLLSTLD